MKDTVITHEEAALVTDALGYAVKHFRHDGPPGRYSEQDIAVRNEFADRCEALLNAKFKGYVYGLSEYRIKRKS